MIEYIVPEPIEQEFSKLAIILVEEWGKDNVCFRFPEQWRESAKDFNYCMIFWEHEAIAIQVYYDGQTRIMRTFPLTKVVNGIAVEPEH